MPNEDKSWMRMSRYTSEWQAGFKNFLQSVFGGTSSEETAPCPCTRCRCMSYRSEKEVRTHVALRGFDESFIEGEGNCEPLLVENDNDDGAALDHAESSHELISSLIRGVIHGEVTGRDEDEPNATAKKLYRLLEEAKKELYPGCKEFGYGARDYLYYKKRCGGDVATIEPIEYLRDADKMLHDSAMEKEIRLIMSKEPEGQGNVSITPIKQRGGKRRHAHTGTDKQLDAYKVWLVEMQEEDPEIDFRDDFRDETIDTYKEWLRHTGRRRHMLSLLQEHSDTDNDEPFDAEGGEGNHERRTANNNNRPSHARKPKEGNGASKTRRRGCLKGYKATAKRMKSGTQKLKIEFDPLTGGVCGDNSRTFVDEIVVFTRKKTPLIGVKSWKEVKEIVRESIVKEMMEKACIEVSNTEKGKDRPFLTAEEENLVFQLNYSKTLGTKSYKCHGRGYMAKYPTRRALLKQREEDAARAELDAQEERMQHQEEVRELKEQLANEVSARQKDKEESKKQMDEMRVEFRQLLQQAMSGTMIPTQVSNGPTDQNFITPPRLEADAVQTAEPQSVMTTEKEVVAPHTIKAKSTSARNIFTKTNAAAGSTMSFVSSDQLLRTRNQKKNQQRNSDSQNN